MSDNLNLPKDSAFDFVVHTYGCKVNSYDSGLIEKRLFQKGHAASETKPRVHILNTCAVTAEATKEAVKKVRKIKSLDPQSTVVVTGCSAQVDGQAFDSLSEVDLVVANSHKVQLEDLLRQHFNGELNDKVFRSNIFKKDDLEEGGGLDSDHTRTFLKVQDGCNSFCTYCVIPFARGKSRSLSVRDLAARVQGFHESGIREVVLTGVHIGDYEDSGKASPKYLADLVRVLLEETEIERIRLGSLEPVELTPELMGLFANGRLCPHFHMSIQSANTKVLQLMKRKYSAEQVEDSLNMISAMVPGAFVGMDVIVGFPGETEDDFQETYLRLARLPWTRLHVFPYSERPGTKALALPDSVKREARAFRAMRLRELSLDRYNESAAEQIGKIKKVLVLKSPAKGADGLSRDYWNIAIPELSSWEDRPVGQELDIQIKGFDHSLQSRIEGHLVGEVIANGR